MDFQVDKSDNVWLPGCSGEFHSVLGIVGKYAEYVTVDF